VILVDFSDELMNASAVQRFRDLFFSTGSTIRTGSVTEYYQDVSGGEISMTGEVIGPYRMPRTIAQYANGQSGMGNTFPNTRTLGADALAAARGNINFRPYDNDGNGYVDAFVVVHAGIGAEFNRDPNSIWSVKWVLPNQESVDGVNVFAFLTIPEDAEVGVCAHELGHLVFGWPDLYDIDNPTIGIIGVESEGIGNWCLMAGGSWGHLPGDAPGTTPCHPSAWCKASQGWITLRNQTTNTSISLPDVKTQQHEVYRLWTNGDTTSQEYFLIENRQKTGFDGSLPGGGLLSESNYSLSLESICIY
jgi:immune inhibitor A